MTVAMMSLDDWVLHLPSDTHGVARCGQTMREPWKAGPLDMLEPDTYCLDCFVPSEGSLSNFRPIGWFWNGEMHFFGEEDGDAHHEAP